MRCGLPSHLAWLPTFGLPLLPGQVASELGARGPEQKPGCAAGLEHDVFLVHLQGYSHILKRDVPDACRELKFFPFLSATHKASHILKRICLLLRHSSSAKDGRLSQSRCSGIQGRQHM